MNWLLLLALLPVSARAQPAIWALEKAIALKYPVPQISGDSLAVRMTRGDSTLLVFDTRPVEEYDVSRLRDAIRIDPDLGVEEFIAAHGEGLSGRDLIFYCSVGYRSSDVVQRVIRAAQERGARSVSNLRGGLFRWYNEDRPLFRDAPVDTVHPYDAQWGRFLRKKEPVE
ncbi:MAG: rhodanese-like domain-containing protein [Candidatus Latescibacterota bacterium]|nr:rhodanese-like domain-containing protein [Candidatus Latescibacterota bacterium]